MDSYVLDEEARQIVSPLGEVVADVHGLGTARGRRDAETMVRALNRGPARLQTLRRLRAEAESLAASGDTPLKFRQLAAVVADLVREGAL